MAGRPHSSIPDWVKWRKWVKHCHAPLCFLLWVPWDQLPHNPEAMPFQEPEESFPRVVSISWFVKAEKTTYYNMLLVYAFTMLYFLALEYSCLKQCITKCSAHGNPISWKAEEGRPSVEGSLRHIVILSPQSRPELERWLRSSRGPGFHFSAAVAGNPTSSSGLCGHWPCGVQTHR